MALHIEVKNTATYAAKNLAKAILKEQVQWEYAFGIL